MSNITTNIVQTMNNAQMSDATRILINKQASISRACIRNDEEIKNRICNIFKDEGCAKKAIVYLRDKREFIPSTFMLSEIMRVIPHLTEECVKTNQEENKIEFYINISDEVTNKSFRENETIFYEKSKKLSSYEKGKIFDEYVEVLRSRILFNKIINVEIKNYAMKCCEETFSKLPRAGSLQSLRKEIMCLLTGEGKMIREQIITFINLGREISISKESEMVHSDVIKLFGIWNGYTNFSFDL